MYKHILIPTDGSELAGHGVNEGLSMAKSVGAMECAPRAGQVEVRDLTG